MTTSDQLVLVCVGAAMLLVVAHMLRENPRNPLLAGAILCICLASVLKRLFFT